MVALDPSTGAILAMVTQPSYNPNVLASHDFAAVEDDWRRLTTDETSRCSTARAQQILPPGSTFKLVTAAAALANLDTQPERPGQGRQQPVVHLPDIQYKLTNDGRNCGGDRITFERALNISCNVSFGWLAGKVGQDDLAAQARKFGFGADTLAGLASNPSRFTARTRPRGPQLAQSGIGQFEVAATPLQMAMVAGGIGNGGDVMSRTSSRDPARPDLESSRSPSRSELSQAMSSGQRGRSSRR